MVCSPAFIPRYSPFLKDHTAALPAIYNALLYFSPSSCKETNYHHCPAISQDDTHYPQIKVLPLGFYFILKLNSTKNMKSLRILNTF